jgi:hypothetical protein
LCAAFLVGISTGCLGGLDYLWGKATATKRDVTEDEVLWGGFRLGGEYRLKYDFFLTQRDDWSKRLALSGTNQIKGALDISVAEYERNPANWPHILGVVASGVHIKCVKLVSYGAPGYGRSLFPFAEILDGPHQGTIVEINTLRSYKSAEKGPKGMVLPKPDYQLLEEVAVDIDEDGS